MVQQLGAVQRRLPQILAQHARSMNFLPLLILPSSSGARSLSQRAVTTRARVSAAQRPHRHAASPSIIAGHYSDDGTTASRFMSSNAAQQEEQAASADDG